MIGTTFVKTAYDPDEYTQAALWCNAHEATIVDRGDRWEVVAIPAPTLSELQAEAISLLKEARTRAEDEPITYDGNTFDYDSTSRTRLRIARQAIEDGAISAIDWTLSDNRTARLTREDFIAINTAAAQRSADLHAHYNQAKQLILSAADRTALDDILAQEGLSR